MRFSGYFGIFIRNSYKEKGKMLESTKKQEIIQKFGGAANNTGSSEAQIAILSERIARLTDHLKINKKDFSTRLGLLKLVSRRKRLLGYLRANSYERYVKISADLGIKIR